MHKAAVLIADSNVHEVKSMTKILSASEQLVICEPAYTGYEAVRLAQLYHPKVILLNISMEFPCAGLNIAYELKRINEESNIIFLSDNVQPELICQAYAIGGVSYLTRPVKSALLTKAVLTAAKGEPYIVGYTAKVLLEDYRRTVALQKNLSSIFTIGMKLTNAELSILHMLVNGMQLTEIEKLNFIEHSTMKSHISHIKKKFDMDSLLQIIDTLKQIRFFDYIQLDINRRE